jgi:hypothetical protein
MARKFNPKTGQWEDAAQQTKGLADPALPQQPAWYSMEAAKQRSKIEPTAHQQIEARTRMPILAGIGKTMLTVNDTVNAISPINAFKNNIIPTAKGLANFAYTNDASGNEPGAPFKPQTADTTTIQPPTAVANAAKPSLPTIGNPVQAEDNQLPMLGAKNTPEQAQQIQLSDANQQTLQGLNTAIQKQLLPEQKGNGDLIQSYGPGIPSQDAYSRIALMNIITGNDNDSDHVKAAKLAAYFGLEMPKDSLQGLAMAYKAVEPMPQKLADPLVDVVNQKKPIFDKDGKFTGEFEENPIAFDKRRMVATQITDLMGNNATVNSDKSARQKQAEFAKIQQMWDDPNTPAELRAKIAAQYGLK